MHECIPQLNIAQELFLVLFAILYGIMLQSMSGLHPFPLGRLRRGYVNRHHEVDLQRREFCECKRVFAKKKGIPIVRTRDDCTRRDFGQWLICMWRKRTAWSIFILSFLPIAYLWFVLGLLSKVTLSGELLSSDFVNVLFIFWSALGVFGFYRIYHALIAWRWEILFCDVTEKLDKRGTSFDGWAHLLFGVLPYLLPPLHYLFLVNFLPTLLGTLGIYPTLFLVWLIYVIDC